MPDVTLTTADLLLVAPVLRSIGEKPLPIKLGYWVAKARAKVEKEIVLIEQRRVALCEAHAERSEDGKPVLKKQLQPSGQVVDGYVFPDQAAFDAAWKELTGIEITLTNVRTFTLAEFEALDASVQVTPNELYGLGPFLQEATPA